MQGYHALQSYRIAHALWNRGQQILALALQSRISEVRGLFWGCVQDSASYSKCCCTLRTRAWLLKAGNALESGGSIHGSPAVSAEDTQSFAPLSSGLPSSLFSPHPPCAVCRFLLWTSTQVNPTPDLYALWATARQQGTLASPVILSLRKSFLPPTDRPLSSFAMAVALSRKYRGSCMVLLSSGCASWPSEGCAALHPGGSVRSLFCCHS